MIANFTPEELLPKELQDLGWLGVTRYLDARVVMCLNYIRQTLAKSITVNTAEEDGRTIRFPRHESYREKSDHSYGLAIDFIVDSMNSLDVQRWIVKDSSASMQLRLLGLTNIEDGTEGWTHISVADITGWNIPIVNGIGLVTDRNKIKGA